MKSVYTNFHLLWPHEFILTNRIWHQQSFSQILGPKGLYQRSIIHIWSEVKSLSHVQLFATLWTVAHQVHWSLGLSRQGYWNGLPCPPPVYLPTQGLNPGFPHCRQTPYTLNHQGSHFRIWTSRKGQDCREWSWRQDRIGSGEPWMIFNVFPMWGKEKNNVDRRWSIVDCDSNNPSKMMLSGL